MFQSQEIARSLNDANVGRPPLNWLGYKLVIDKVEQHGKVQVTPDKQSSSPRQASMSQLCVRRFESVPRSKEIIRMSDRARELRVAKATAAFECARQNSHSSSTESGDALRERQVEGEPGSSRCSSRLERAPTRNGIEKEITSSTAGA